VEELEARHGSLRGTIMLGGWRVSLEDAPEGPYAEESQAQGKTEHPIEETEEAQQRRVG
jgi:hypothetical protein